MCMWVIKFFSNSCSVRLTYVLHLCTCAYARVTGYLASEFSIRARIFKHYIYDGISELNLGSENFLSGPGFLDITYNITYLF